MTRDIKKFNCWWRIYITIWVSKAQDFSISVQTFWIDNSPLQHTIFSEVYFDKSRVKAPFTIA